MDEKQELLPSEEIRRRLQEKAQILAELEARNPKPAGSAVEAINEQVREQMRQPGSVLVKRITGDGRTLAGLMSRAKKLEDAAIALEERAQAARENAKEARGYLDEYLRENGLA